MEILCWTFWGSSKLLFKVAVPFCISPSNIKGSSFCPFRPIFVVHLFYNSCLSEYKDISHCGFDLLGREYWLTELLLYLGCFSPSTLTMSSYCLLDPIVSNYKSAVCLTVVFMLLFQDFLFVFQHFFFLCYILIWRLCVYSLALPLCICWCANISNISLKLHLFH